ncbi:MAG: site-specific integrase, partial [Planctomycetota bacterium]
MPSTQTRAISEKLLSLPLGRHVNDFLNYLSVEAGLAENTIQAYGRDLKSFLQHCNSHKIKNLLKIKPAFIQNYLVHLSRSNKDEASIKRALVAIKTFFKFAHLNNLTESD